MNAQSLIGRKSDLRTGRRTGYPRRLQSEVVRLIGSLGKRVSVQLKGFFSRKIEGCQIGQTVHHGDFGSGEIVAAWPDGRLLVKFADRSENLLVYPSLLVIE